jgi:hypothetical protein
MTGGNGGNGVAADATLNAGRVAGAGRARGGAIYCARYQSTFVNSHRKQLRPGGSSGNGGAFSDGGGPPTTAATIPPVPINIDPDRIVAKPSSDRCGRFGNDSRCRPGAYSPQASTDITDTTTVLGGGPMWGLSLVFRLRRRRTDQRLRPNSSSARSAATRPARPQRPGRGGHRQSLLRASDSVRGSELRRRRHVAVIPW